MPWLALTGLTVTECWEATGLSEVDALVTSKLQSRQPKRAGATASVFTGSAGLGVTLCIRLGMKELIPLSVTEVMKTWVAPVFRAREQADVNAVLPLSPRTGTILAHGEAMG